jgi:hypothetical protein
MKLIMILSISILSAVVGLLLSIQAKKIFHNGLSESDSYRMIMEFNRSKKMRRYSTYFLLTAMVTFTIYMIQLMINYNTK